MLKKQIGLHCSRFVFVRLIEKVIAPPVPISDRNLICSSNPRKCEKIANKFTLCIVQIRALRNISTCDSEDFANQILSIFIGDGSLFSQ